MVKRKEIDFGFTPSIYQEKIFDFVQHGVGNAVISALAGSGKTSTIVACMKLIPKSQKCLFLAFNKSIVETLTEKVSDNPNCHIRTMHSLGYLMIRRNLGNEIDIDEYKYTTYVKKNIADLTTVDEQKMTRSQVNNYIDNILALVSFSRYNLAQSEKEITSIADKYNIPLLFDEPLVVQKVLEWGSKNYETIDYTDMVWLPYELGLKPLGMQYDWVLFDEAQDASKAYIELFTKCIKRGGRFIAVGDKKQCQPYGTQILMCDGTTKNIEDIEIGDKVVTFQPKQRTFKYYKTKKGGAKVVDKRTDICQRLVSVDVGEGENHITTQYTPEHMCYVRFNQKAADGYLAYLMTNDNNEYKIGTCRFGKLQKTLNDSIYKYAWLLYAFEDKVSAKTHEYSYSNTMIRYNHSIESFLSHEMGLDFTKPYTTIYETENRESKQIFSIDAANLIPEFMDLLVFDEKAKKKGTDRISGRYETITKVEFMKKTVHVVSLETEREHNYIADGILTHNCINAFAGSNPEAFDFLCNYPNTQVFELPITYRCPIKVVEMTKEYVPNMLPRENAPEGKIMYDCKISDIQDGDMVLARSKTPLIKLYTKLIKKGVKSYIKGKDIGMNLIKLLDPIDLEDLNPNLDKDGVFVRLYDNLFTDRNKLMNKYDITKDDATLSGLIMDRYDSINCMLTLAEKLHTKDELIKKITNVFQDNKSGIVLSTVHKAKGLEANNVFILCRSSMPSKLAHLEWEREQEENLIYVAITRPKQSLGFVSEKEIRPSGSLQEPNEILNEMQNIEKTVCRILNKEITPDNQTIAISRVQAQAAEDLTDVIHPKEENTIVMSKDEADKFTIKIDENKEVTTAELMSSIMQYLADDKSKEDLMKFLNGSPK